MLTPILHVRDVDLSLAFYTRVLGFQGEGGLPGIDGKAIYAEVYLGDMKIMLRRRNPANSPFVSNVCGVDLYLSLPETFDIGHYHSALKAREVNIIDDLHDEIWGDHAFSISDLDSYRLIFSQPAQYTISLPLIEKNIA